VTGEVDPPSSPAVVTDHARVNEGPDTVSMLLSAWIDAWRRDQLLPVTPILQRLNEQSMVARQRLEIEVLRAVASLFDHNLFDPKLSKARREAARALIIGLDDDYAWTGNDRRLHEMIKQPAADRFGQMLRVIRQWESTGAAPNAAPSVAPNGAPPAVAKTRAAKPQGWAFAGFGGVVFFIMKGLLLVATQYHAPAPASTPARTDPYAQAQLALDNAEASFNQGVAFDNNGQFDRAIHAYSEAIGFYPDYGLAYYNRGLAYASQGNLDRAIADYDEAIRLYPGNPDYFVSRGAAYHGKGQVDRAIQDYDQAIRLKPDDGLAFVDRGLAYADKGEVDRAIQDDDQAIWIDPKDPDAWRNRGLAKQAMGNSRRGDADIAKAARLSAAAAASSQAVAGKQRP
jgi:tetratricopeptide (TPR) repeat protein